MTEEEVRREQEAIEGEEKWIQAEVARIAQDQKVPVPVPIPSCSCGCCCGCCGCRTNNSLPAVTNNYSNINYK
jgi:hypothetical protein